MGGVVHFEIPVDDLDAGSRFYSEVFGWKLEAFGDVGYLLATTTPTGPDGRPTERGVINGALMRREPDAPAPLPVIGVDSVEDALSRVEAAGGAVVRPKTEIPTMGWYAYARDPQGSVIGLWETMPAA